MNIKFKPGKEVMTRGVSVWSAEGDRYGKVLACLKRHLSGDWGDLCQEDKDENDHALENGFRILSAYVIDGIKIWIITEADRSATTVLFPDEY